MSITLEPYHVFMVAATSVAAFFGLGKMLANQILSNIEHKLSSLSSIKSELKEITATTYSIERDLLRMQIENSNIFVKREDFIRFEASIDAKESSVLAKIDALTSKIEQYRDKGGHL